MAKAVAMLQVALVAVVVVAAASAGGAAAQQCDVETLAPCAPAFIGGSPPTAQCCTDLRAQQPCFCQYASNPAYSGYLNSPNARAALAACGIAYPTC